MNGRVDESGRALVEVVLRAARTGPTTSVSAWVDTGFTGELVLPSEVVENLKLSPSGTTAAILADGSAVTLPTYECYIVWFDQLLRLQILANAGKHSLLGVGLLRKRDLHINYSTGQLTIE